MIPRVRGWRRVRICAAALVVAACSSPTPPTPVVSPVPIAPWPTTESPRPAAPPKEKAPAERPTARPNGAAVRDVGDTTVRVLISSGEASVRVGSSGGFALYDREGNSLSNVSGGETWHVIHEGRRVRAVRADGVATAWADAPVRARALGDGLLEVNGKPYRGDLEFFGGAAGDSGVVVVNVARIDDYLRGVVPLEIGTRSAADSAAVQAQAVTARSYAFVHLSTEPMREYDVTSGVLDQVYGGVAAETAVASEAVESTRTLVLQYAGRVVNAPYHSTCGGETAAASEVWHSSDEPYLQPVSDRIPGTSRYYCDIAPRFHWTRTLDAKTLNAAVARYLSQYVKVPGSGRNPGVVQDVRVESHTVSGRVGTLAIETDRGNYLLRGNDIRYVLRAPGGEILNSTYFSIETSNAVDGALEQLIVRGNGYGHGVGMCQWGAIGRARAGQDFRTILDTYYPGTTVAPAAW
jgi:stage II sporulation protein D